MKKKRYEGCLIGGAVGDALGYPVEFWRENEIFHACGPEGIRTLEEAGDPAVVSDDTQMTLFASNAILYYLRNTNIQWKSLIRIAYREWYVTQSQDRSLLEAGGPIMEIFSEKRLHVRRAPGNSCLGSIYDYIMNPELQYTRNYSKGCGTVMRAAPYGLAVRYDPFVDGAHLAAEMAKEDAMITHGHEDAWKSSAALASTIFEIVQEAPKENGKKLQDVIQKNLFVWENDCLCRKAVALAEDNTIDDLDGIHQLGEGWVADEALAIAIFCAVRYQDDFAKAIRTAVNHNGDSDSTGAICGNILGAWLGIDEVKKAFNLKKLEMHDRILRMADDLYEAVEGDCLMPISPFGRRDFQDALYPDPFK